MKMTLIVLSVVCVLLIGLQFYNSYKIDSLQKELEQTKITESATTADVDDTTEDKNRDYYVEQGRVFEKFIASKFKDKRFFTLIEWQGDKAIDGVYAESNKKPDLLIEQNVGNHKYQYFVECKWKNSAKNGIVELPKYQFDRYNSFANESGSKIYIALGISGTGEEPKDIYMIPLDKLSSNKIHLESYKWCKFNSSIKDFKIYFENYLKKHGDKWKV